jgi:cytochrome d ubiquinol oxidase subunit II
MIPDTVGAILLASLTLYATLAGADFGGGFWDLVAGGDRRGEVPRSLIDETIGPVWEANHVWLVFVLVVFWTGFPTAFAAVMTATFIPLSLAALGIVLRGSGFAFRKNVSRLGARRLLGATFALSSLVTPFFMGTAIGAIAAGKVTVGARSSTLAIWTGSISILIGALFVTICAYLAAIYLIKEAIRRHDQRLERYFSRRAIIAGVASGALSIAALADLHHVDISLYRGLSGRALPLVVIAGVLGLVVLALLVAGRPIGLRLLSAAGVAAVVWGWGVAEYPHLLPGTGLTLSNGSAPRSTLIAIIQTFVVAAVTVGPSFLLLFYLHGRRLLDSEHA